MDARRFSPWLALTCLLITSAARAGDFQESGINVVPFAGWTVFDRELRAPVGFGAENHLDYGGRVGVRLYSPLWLDLAGGYTPIRPGGRDGSWTHLSANLMLVSSRPLAVSPFVSLGGGVSKFVPAWSRDQKDGTFEAAAGLKVKISNALGLRLEARNVLLVPREHYDRSHIDNIVLGAGLVFAFGGKPVDTDGDGVPDRLDRCPTTPAGCLVDANGCSLDADQDGVCDGVDKCPGTPRGAIVDAAGCPKDSDGDGVWDGIDKCPDTPRGATVDATGCPTDADGDGVWDGIDKCPDSPRGCKVDAAGCPIDSDGDGVCDGLDKCPDSPRGSRVDAEGCPITEVRQREIELLDTGLIRLKDVKFATAKASVLPESEHELKVVGEVLSKWPRLKIEIGGYCDSRGSDAYNLALSKRRVTSVRAYLLAHFPKLEAAQLTAVGYGETLPLQPNTSPENMAENRRVEFKVLNKEELRQVKP